DFLSCAEPFAELFDRFGGHASAFGFSAKLSDVDSVSASQVIIQSDSAVTAVRVLMGALPGIFFIGSALCVVFLPVNKAKFNEILAALKKRRGEA
ncbi:MAG: hypothetical protein ACRCUT_01805, partial [Spirochaetota bacterium]